MTAILRRFRTAAVAAFVWPLALACLPACTTTREIVGEEEGVRETTLFVTQAGDTVTMQWKSLPGMMYTILYADNRGSQARWKPLPDAVRIPGTGEDIQWQDRAPRGIKRFYRLHIEESSGGSP